MISILFRYLLVSNSYFA